MRESYPSEGIEPFDHHSSGQTDGYDTLRPDTRAPLITPEEQDLPPLDAYPDSTAFPPREDPTPRSAYEERIAEKR